MIDCIAKFTANNVKIEAKLSSGETVEIYTSLTKRYEENKKALLAEKETIAAVLSLSDDKDYQVEVLKNYGILDKKGMMVEDDE